MPPETYGRHAVKAKANTHATRASVPDNVTNNRGKEYETTAALSRPRRETTILPSSIDLKKSVAAAKKTATMTPSKKRGRPSRAAIDGEPVDEPPKKRGRPAKASIMKGSPKKRGRPAKKAAEVDVGETETEEEEEESVNEPVAAPRPRGRPSKVKKTFPLPKKVATKAVSKPPAKPGRPSRADIAATEDDVEVGTEKSADDGASAPKQRGPGRPSKKVEDAIPEDETAPPKKRGRPPKRGQTTKIAGDDDAAADQLEDELIDTAEQVDSEATAVREKGKTAKGKGKGKSAKVEMPAFDEDDADAEEEQEQPDSGKQYWLMKAEQEDREETLANGEIFNTKFTIDDLKSRGGPEPWDGVRNPVAAKNMRTMKKGDLAFFYASGGKRGRKPGIVGIMEIVKEYEPDQTAWDEGAYGYVEDEKLRSKWCVVYVEYRKKLSSPVHLSELQKYMRGNGVLSEMQVLKQSRLSVTKVSEREWNFITEKLIEGFEEDNALWGVEASLANEDDEGESTLIATDQAKADALNDESPRKEPDLPQGIITDGLALSIIEGAIPSTDTIFPVETSQTSRPASRGGSHAPSVKPYITSSRQGSRVPSIEPKATTSRQSLRASSVTAASLASPFTNDRGRSHTPTVRAGSAAPANAETGDGAAGMQTIGEDDE